VSGSVALRPKGSARPVSVKGTFVFWPPGRLLQVRVPLGRDDAMEAIRWLMENEHPAGGVWSHKPFVGHEISGGFRLEAIGQRRPNALSEAVVHFQSLKKGTLVVARISAPMLPPLLIAFIVVLLVSPKLGTSAYVYGALAFVLLAVAVFERALSTERRIIRALQRASC
jgi:hypothetical protein